MTLLKPMSKNAIALKLKKMLDIKKWGQKYSIVLFHDLCTLPFKSFINFF